MVSLRRSTPIRRSPNSCFSLSERVSVPDRRSSIIRLFGLGRLLSISIKFLRSARFLWLMRNCTVGDERWHNGPDPLLADGPCLDPLHHGATATTLECED